MRPGFLALLLSALLLCPWPAAGAPTVLVTIKPIHSLVAAVMEGAGTPQLLIGGANSEHSYALKPSDAAKLARAQVVFWVGPELETFLSGPLRNLAPHARVVALGHVAGMHLLAARPGGLWHGPPQRANGGDINPHVWLDPANAIAMVRAITVTLAGADPAEAARYRANETKLIATLTALDGRIAARLSPLRHRPYLVFHDAYPYFEAHYGLKAIGAVAVEPDRPVSPRRVATLRAAIEDGRALCIFREPQFPPALVRTLAEGTHVRIGVLDPLGADLPAGPRLYPMLLQRLADGLAACLSGPHSG